jgi:GDPmannose 4,6-dehydratase
MKSALITGVTGQDGIHLSDLLLTKGYKVYGLVNGQKQGFDERLKRINSDVELVYGDLTDSSSLIRALSLVEPDEVYNLAAQSFVGISFTQPELTANTTGLGVLRLLEAIRTLKMDSHIRLYQASSSEMFGRVRETPQTEQTPFHPRSPYGVSKAFAHYLCVNYRESYNMFIACGILFNHEGPNRGYEFVTRKITSEVAKIALGKSNHMTLGNLDSLRDWGYAGDYVKAMWMMLQYEKPEDFIISTGEVHSVKEFVMEALKAAGLEPDLERYVKQDSRFMRPAEVDILQGDSSKARKLLGWEPNMKFHELVKTMVEADLKILRDLH